MTCFAGNLPVKQSRASGQDVSLTVARQPGEGVLGWRAQAWARASALQNSSVAVAPDRSFTTPAADQVATPAVGWGANLAVRGQGARTTWEVGGDVRGASGESRERFRNLGAGDLFLSASAEHSDGWIPVREGRGAADDRLTLDDWSLAARWTAPRADPRWLS